MLLLLVRHAQAAEQDAARYPDDSLRPLVPKGKKAQRRVSRELVKRGLIPSQVFSSPWRRAWQTARIVIAESGLPKTARIPCEALAVAPQLDALAAEIGTIDADETVALVGHEPWMSELAALLLTGESNGIRIDFAKSGVLGIEAEALKAGSGTLVFYLVP
jgi:phosphohistidine phosphatase